MTRRSPLLEAAAKIGWPIKVEFAAANLGDREAFRDNFLSMLKFQELYGCASTPRMLCAHISYSGQSLHMTSPSDNRPAKEGVYPLQALAHSIALRFKYHFDGTRQTNKLDKVWFP